MARITLTHYLIRHERENGLDPNLRLLLETVAHAVKTIRHAVGKGEIGGVLASAGTTNVQGETKKKLDVIANEKPTSCRLARAATNSSQGILDLVPRRLHERVSVVLGSRIEVEYVTGLHAGR